MESNLNLDKIFVSDNFVVVETGGLIINNILDMRLHEFFFISIYFILFIFLIKFFIKNQKLNKNKAYFLISYHYCFIILAYIYSLLYVNDTDSFFQQAYLFNNFDDQYIANNVMTFVNHFLIYVLNLHYFSIFIFLGFFSSMGFLLLFISFSEILNKFQFNKNLLFTLFLFPTWHFFTSFPGKDSIFLFAIGLFCFSLMKKNFFYLISSISLMYLIRSHIAFLVLASGLLIWMHYFFLDIFKRKIFYFLLFVSILPIFYYFLKNFTPEYFYIIFNFLEEGAVVRGYSTQEPGWYETENNIFSNSFKYLFNPLFDLSSINRLIGSSENIIIISLVFRAFLNFNKKIFYQVIKTKELLFAILIFTAMLVILSNFTANIGISARQKWMMLPFLFLFIIPFIDKLKFYKK